MSDNLFDVDDGLEPSVSSWQEPLTNGFFLATIGDYEREGMDTKETAPFYSQEDNRLWGLNIWNFGVKQFVMENGSLNTIDASNRRSQTSIFVPSKEIATLVSSHKNFEANKGQGIKLSEIPCSCGSGKMHNKCCEREYESAVLLAQLGKAVGHSFAESIPQGFQPTDEEYLGFCRHLKGRAVGALIVSWWQKRGSKTSRYTTEYARKYCAPEDVETVAQDIFNSGYWSSSIDYGKECVEKFLEWRGNDKSDNKTASEDDGVPF